MSSALFRRLRVPSALLICCLVLLVNCRQSAAPEGPELTLNLGAEPPTIDPLLATDPPTIQLDNLLFANLVLLNESDGAPQPGLAQEWLVSSDGLVWEFRLRDDARWARYDPETDQIARLRPINSQDVVYSVRRLFDPRTASGYAARFAPLIKNAETFLNADPRTPPEDLDQLADAVGVHALDERRVRFELTRPLSAFPTLVGAWLGRIVPREVIEENGVDWTEIGTIWSSGPYVLTEREPNRAFVLRKNPHYYDAGAVTIERLRFRFIPDVASALDAYLSGQLDTTDPYDSIEGVHFERVEADPALAGDLKLLPGLCTQYIGFDTTKRPFDNVLVRQAFALSFNRDDLVSQVYKLGEPARWFTPPQVNAAPVAESDIGIDFNAPLARTTLDTAFGRGPRLPSLVFGTNTNDLFIRSAVAAIQYWRATLAAVITVEDADWSVYLEQLRTSPPPLFRMGYCGSYPDAEDFAYTVFHSRSPYNFTGWSSPQYDRLVEEAAFETDVLKRRQLYARAEKLLVEDQAVILPVAWTLRASLTRPRVERTYAVMEGHDRIERWRIK